MNIDRGRYFAGLLTLNCVIVLSLLIALLTGSTSKAIRRLSELLIATNNSIVCGDVVESSLQMAFQLINEEDFKIAAILDIMGR